MGLILFGSPPSFNTASLILAKSTTAGTPVKSIEFKMIKHVEQLKNKLNIHKPCNITRAGLKDTSTSLSLEIPFASFQFKMFFTSFSKTWKLSQFLTADSNKTRIENGSSSVIESVRLNQLCNIYYFTVFISKS